MSSLSVIEVSEESEVTSLEQEAGEAEAREIHTSINEDWSRGNRDLSSSK